MLLLHVPGLGVRYCEMNSAQLRRFPTKQTPIDSLFRATGSSALAASSRTSGLVRPPKGNKTLPSANSFWKDVGVGNRSRCRKWRGRARTLQAFWYRGKLYTRVHGG